MPALLVPVASVSVSRPTPASFVRSAPLSVRIAAMASP
jgi:hypothetical protein